LHEHLARHPGGLDPESSKGRECYETWKELLTRIEGIDFQAATVASKRLVIEPPPTSKHFTMLRAFIIQEIRERPRAAGQPKCETREEAHRAARGCERCNGEGLTPVYARDFDAPEPKRVNAHCVCAMGRWARAQFQRDAESRALMQGIPDLAEILNGFGPWQDWNPDGVGLEDPRRKPF
jgi:hypothetical protein